MQRSFVAKTTVNFPDFELYVRMGDILVFNAANENSLTVYRGGAIVKTIRTTPISIAVLLKTKMIEETVALAPKPVRPAPPKPAAAPKPAPKPKAPPKDTPPPKSKESSVKSVNMRNNKGENVLPNNIPAIDNPEVQVVETLREDGRQSATVKVSGVEAKTSVGQVVFSVTPNKDSE